MYLFLTGDFSWIQVFTYSPTIIANNAQSSIPELNNTYFSIQSLKQVFIVDIIKWFKSFTELL